MVSSAGICGRYPIDRPAPIELPDRGPLDFESSAARGHRPATWPLISGSSSSWCCYHPPRMMSRTFSTVRPPSPRLFDACRKAGMNCSSGLLPAACRSMSTRWRARFPDLRDECARTVEAPSPARTHDVEKHRDAIARRLILTAWASCCWVCPAPVQRAVRSCRRGGPFRIVQGIRRGAQRFSENSRQWFAGDGDEASVNRMAAKSGPALVSAWRHTRAEAWLEYRPDSPRPRPPFRYLASQ